VPTSEVRDRQLEFIFCGGGVVSYGCGGGNSSVCGYS